MKGSTTCAGLFILALLGGVSQPALAQIPPPIGFSVGYQFVHAPDVNFRFGAGGDIAGAIRNSPVWILGELGWVHHGEDSQTAAGNLLNFGAGLQLRLGPPAGMVTGRWAMPYIQLVGGGLRASSQGLVSTHKMLQAGAGLSIAPGWRADAKIITQVDWRRVFFESARENHLRVFVGIGLGSR
jgi:hypothetical protein